MNRFVSAIGTHIARFAASPHYKRNYYIAYTVCFSVFALVAFSRFIAFDSSLIHQGDGWDQHFKALVYYAQYLRGIAKNLVFDQRLVIPDWEFHLSEGADIVSTLHYYAIGDPLNLLAVFVPTRYMHYLYSFLCVLRLYLAGIAFSALCFGTGQRRRAGILVGALSYCFCMWGLLNATRHPFFLNPMIYFPLMVLGMEQIIRRKNPYVFIFATVLSAVSQFYFFYMIVILSVLYAIIRLGMLNKTDLKASLATLAYMLGMAVIGALIAGIILLPVLMTFAGNSRLGMPMETQWLYPLSYYLTLPGILASHSSDQWLVGGFTAPVLLAVPLLFSDKGRNAFLKVLVAACLLIAALPMAGRLLNGMSYATNRWCWALALLLSYVLVVQWPRLLSLSKRNRNVLLGFCAAYFIICIVFSESRTAEVFAAIALMLLTVLLLNAKPLRNRTAARSTLLALIALACVFNTSSGKFPFDGNFYLEKFKENGKVVTESKANEARLIASETDDAYPRYTGRGVTPNGNLVGRASSTQFYWSLSNPYVHAWRSDVGVEGTRDYHYSGYNDRAALIALASVGYYTAKDSDTQGMPYGFTATDIAQDEDFTVYRNENALPIGYCYERVMTADTWKELNPVQKQEAQLEAVLVDAPSHGNAVKGYSPAEETYEASYDLSLQSSNVYEVDNGLLTTSKNAKVKLSLQNQSACSETYIGFTGFDYETWPKFDLYFGGDRIDPGGKYDEKAFNKLFPAEKLALLSKKLKWDPVQNVELTAALETGRTVNINYDQPESPRSNGRNSFVANMGYSEDPVTEITVTLPKRGLYAWDSLKVYQVPMEGFEEKIARLKADSLENVKLGTDTVSGTLALDEQKLLCMAIPYSTGWRAFIDGEETEALCMNERYVGMSVPAGDHEIEIRYSSPYKREGLALTCAGLVLLCALAIVRRRHAKRNALHERTGD